jgi:hypothetical protein
VLIVAVVLVSASAAFRQSARLDQILAWLRASRRQGFAPTKRANFEQLLAAFGGTPQQISNYSKLAEMVVIRCFLARWLGSFMERSAQVISPGVAIRGSHI